MKKTLICFILIISIISTILLCSCSDNSIINGTSNGGTTNSQVDTTTPAEAVTDDSVTAEEVTGDFTITTEDGTYSQSGNVYTITTAGTYVLEGALDGQIVVDAGDDDKITLELNGTTIKYSADSPIKILNADSVDISAKDGTENVIKDTRSAKTVDTDTQGEGAIYAKCDLKIKGNGTLVISAGYNNGIHTTKDLTIQKLSLKVTAYNNAIKGNDSITIKSGTIVAISTNGDGIKTENTDANKKGVTRGDITFGGGSIAVYAAGDGIQAAHNFTMTSDDGETSANVTIYTGSYSGYTASSASTTSYKGVKVQNILLIEAGTITLNTYDDGLHADYGTTFEDGTTGVGTITIAGGTVTCAVYAPANKTATGRQGPGGWGGQQSVSGADAIHADYILNISGGTVTVDSSYEGLEATIINISGGYTVVSASDDGVNAAKKVNTTPQINVTGGYLEVNLNPNGDTDGIDSNGTYTQSGGVVVAKGPNSQMAAALDSDGTAKITGGTIIILGALGERGLSTSGVSSKSLSLHSSGSHTVTIDGVSYTFTNAYSYSKTICYSSVSVS